VAIWNSTNGKQGSDSAKLAAALVELASQDETPVRWVAGADGVETVEQKGKDLIDQADAYREVSSPLAHHLTGLVSARNARKGK
jgi:hemoglobin-like flavoprotein